MAEITREIQALQEEKKLCQESRAKIGREMQVRTVTKLLYVKAVV